MKTVGIIAEYNPFHNGHAYQIAKAKEVTGADYCIVVMSGNFVQRGTPAFMDKWIRTKAALQNGADLVIELPVYYAVSSAEYFAMGAVTLLDKLGADFLCFGSECGDINAMSALADAFLQESDSFKNCLKEALKTGMTYPAARKQALAICSPHLKDYLPLLQEPNNILGIEYIKAILKRNSTMLPYTISRTGAGYHTASLQEAYSSANALRQTISDKQDISLIKNQVPDCTYEELLSHYQKNFPILPEDISALLFYKLLSEDTDFTKYLDIDFDFSDRIKKMLLSYTDYKTFCEQLKSKNITYTRVARNLIHILLNLTQADWQIYQKEDYIYYARMLGFNQNAAPLLSALKEKSKIPFFSKLADYKQYIPSEHGREMLQKDIQSSHLYSLLVHQKFGQPFTNEYKTQIIIV